ncbi:MAG: amidohydrolase family protein [Candidatus Brocadia sp.]
MTGVFSASLITLFVALLTIITGCGTIAHFGGNFRGEPFEMWDAIGPEAKFLIKNAFEFETCDYYEIVDYHTHVFGTGYSIKTLCPEIDTTGVYFNPRLFTWKGPTDRLKTLVFLSAMNINNPESADEQYARRLLELLQGFPPHANIKFCIFALDAYHDDTGEINWDRTDLYVPNDYVIKLADCLNEKMGREYFIPVISIHPLRKNAIELLQHYHDHGVKYVKWLPSVMNIDPASYTSAPFLKMMAKMGMILLTHTGDEMAFTVYDDHQKYGNPMRLRQALDLGVTVVMQHCGQITLKNDPDYPYHGRGEKDQNYKLFRRMMNEDKYKDRLFGEIAALTIPMTQHLLFDILEDKELQGRMVNGSDYPIPAANILKPTESLYYAGAITKDEQEALDEIYSYNPLLFDFVVKRTLRHPDTGGRLPESMFTSIEWLKILRQKQQLPDD